VTLGSRDSRLTHMGDGSDDIYVYYFIPKSISVVT
jgi:hypothetical protein